MTKKIKSTYDEYVQGLSPERKKKFEEGYQELLLSELLIAIMKKDAVSVRNLAQAAGISPTIIQGIRSGTKQNVTIQSFVKILNALGYSLVIERGRNRFPLELPHS